MQVELKPCPFCGEQCAVLGGDIKWAGYQPSCLEVRTGYDSSPDAEWRTEAIAAWNTRERNPAMFDNFRWPLGTRVTKTKGSQWTGKVVGFYSTSLTAEGYAVESETERGSVQIYPVAALKELGDAS